MIITDSKNNKLAFKFSALNAKQGLEFLSPESDFLQLGTWRYGAGKTLLAHTHNIVPREINRTQECALVIKGSMNARIYDEDAQLVTTVRVNALEGVVLLAGGHGYDILEEDTIVVEVKNGPYPGAEIDRRRIEGNASPQKAAA